MTQQQKNEAVARALGWILHEEEPFDGKERDWWEIPNHLNPKVRSLRRGDIYWCSDLNAVQRDVFPLIEKLDLWGQIWQRIPMVPTIGASYAPRERATRDALLATPEQLVDACLGAIKQRSIDELVSHNEKLGI